MEKGGEGRRKEERRGIIEEGEESEESVGKM